MYILIEAMQLRHIPVKFRTLSEEQLKYQNHYWSHNTVLSISQILPFTLCYTDPHVVVHTCLTSKVLTKLSTGGVAQPFAWLAPLFQL